MTQTKTVATSSDSCYSQEGTAIMASICKKCGGKKKESDAICDYCHESQERHSINQVVGRRAAIMPCKKCGGNKAESGSICDYCHKAQEDPNINQAEMLKLRNRGRPYPRPHKKYKLEHRLESNYYTRDT